MVSSVELIQAYIARADANPGLNVYRDSGSRRGHGGRASGRCRPRGRQASRGSLHGVPLVVKDNTMSPACRTRRHPGPAGLRPEDNAPTVQKLVDAGAVVLGKTNMHELAFGISGYNEAFFTALPIGTRNPYDRTRIAGGSSSGTGAAIGGRLAPGGLGSDTGGSVRIPAALTGVAGLRPTIGRYSQEGSRPSRTRGIPSAPWATVADVALLDAVITGGRAPEPAPLSGVRLGVNRAYFFKDLDVDTKAVTEAAFEKLRRVGVIIVDVDMPDLQKANDAASFPVALYEAYDDLKAYLAKHQTGVSVEELAAQIASKDVKGTYDGLVIPRKLPTPERRRRRGAGLRGGHAGRRARPSSRSSPTRSSASVSTR